MTMKMTNREMILKVASKRTKTPWKIYELYANVMTLRQKLGMKIIAHSSFERKVRDVNEIKCTEPKEKGVSSWDYWYMGE